MIKNILSENMPVKLLLPVLTESILFVMVDVTSTSFARQTLLLPFFSKIKTLYFNSTNEDNK